MCCNQLAEHVSTERIPSSSGASSSLLPVSAPNIAPAAGSRLLVPFPAAAVALLVRLLPCASFRARSHGSVRRHGARSGSEGLSGSSQAWKGPAGATVNAKSESAMDYGPVGKISRRHERLVMTRNIGEDDTVRCRLDYPSMSK